MALVPRELTPQEECIGALCDLWRVYSTIELITSSAQRPRGFKRAPDILNIHFDMYVDYMRHAKIIIHLDISDEEKRNILRESKRMYRKKIDNLHSDNVTVATRSKKKTN